MQLFSTTNRFPLNLRKNLILTSGLNIAFTLAFTLAHAENTKPAVKNNEAPNSTNTAASAAPVAAPTAAATTATTTSAATSAAPTVTSNKSDTRLNKTNKKRNKKTDSAKLNDANTSSNNSTSDNNTTKSQTTSVSSIAKTPTLLKNFSFSEYAFAPSQGQKYLKVSPLFTKKNISFKEANNSSSNQDHQSNLVGIEFGTAINDSMSIAISTQLGSNTIETSKRPDVKESGFTDLVLKATKIQNQTANTQLYYGATASISPTDNEIAYNDGKGNSSTGNLFSGGHTLTPFLGYQMDNSNLILGAQGSYTIMGERTLSRKDFKQSINGGNTLAANIYAESLKNKILLGAKAGLSMVQPYDFENDQKGLKTKSDTGAFQLLKLGAYGKITVNQKLELLPNIGLTRLMNSSGGKISLEQNDEFTAYLSARIAL